MAVDIWREILEPKQVFGGELGAMLFRDEFIYFVACCETGESSFDVCHNVG